MRRKRIIIITIALILFVGVAGKVRHNEGSAVLNDYQHTTIIDTRADSGTESVPTTASSAKENTESVIPTEVPAANNVGQAEDSLPNNTFSLGHGDYDLNISVKGESRRYLLHVPLTYNAQIPMPLVLAFHGGTGSAEHMRDSYGFVEKSNKEGFIVAFPNGASRFSGGKFATWNAGECCGYAVESMSDDVGFIKDVISDIENKFNIGKIFATGMSNGGMFSYRLACDMPGVFVAIASVAGTDNYSGCVSQGPVSVLHIHSLEDSHVLYNGGCGPDCILRSETEFTSVPKTVSKWVSRDMCAKDPVRIFENENAYCDLYDSCANGTQVRVCTTKDGGHSWPGINLSGNVLENTPSSQAINATNMIWDFFKRSLAE